jgi:hypothetical protein
LSLLRSLLLDADNDDKQECWMKENDDDDLNTFYKVKASNHLNYKSSSKIKTKLAIQACLGTKARLHLASQK